MSETVASNTRAPLTPQRRRIPRRRLVVPVAIERRRTNRREGALGGDGLRRIVLADDWQLPGNG